MTRSELLATTETLEARILKASRANRWSMQPQLQRMLHNLEADGVPVPRRLKRLNAVLIEEQIEARFDNLPI